MHSYPFDSFDSVCKSPFGAVKAGNTVHFSVILSDFSLFYKCELLLYKADEFHTPVRYDMKIDNAFVGNNRYCCSVALPPVAQLYFYCFELVTEHGVTHIKRIDSHNGDFGEEGELWQLTVYDSSFHTPAPPSRGIIYQIFPDRYYRSGKPKAPLLPDRRLHENWSDIPDFRPDKDGKVTNSDYFGGDLLGIAEKLDTIAELGVSLIYLNPIFEAHSNHRYNVADYFKVDPLLGTNEDFRTLCAEAKKRGIGIILDGVFSHTGSDSVYFNKEHRYGANTGAYNDPDSPYRCWYKFNNYPTDYRSWWNFDTLPEIVEETPAFLDFVCGEKGVIRYWMNQGAQGFRLDVADELPDVILDRIRQAVKESNPHGILIGEVWEDASNKVAYSQRRRYLLGNQLDSVMNYPYMNAVVRFVRYGDSNALYHGILTILENYPMPSINLLFNSLSTHDTARAITLLSGEEYTGGDREWQFAHNTLSPEQYAYGKHLLLIAYTLMYFLPGTPCLYYGDEVGLTGWRDPFNRTGYPWEGADDELREKFVLLGKLYRENEFLKNAVYMPVVSVGDVFCYARTRKGMTLTVAVNRGNHAQDVRSVLPQGEATVITGGYHDGVLDALSAVVVIEREESDEDSSDPRACAVESTLTIPDTRTGRSLPFFLRKKPRD